MASGTASVTIAGGGIAGLTAALRLAERGCAVTLYEEKSMLGGNLATRDLKGGGYLDVYPHMFQGWYHNFWRLMKDVGVKREKSFTKFNSVHQLARGEFPSFTTLTRPYSAHHLLENLSSGFAAPADLFVFGCASLDLMAELRDPTVRLANMSLSGYLGTRLYMTPPALEAYETFISRVWAIPAYLISAADCRRYAGYCYAAADEDSWLTNAPAAQSFLGQIEAKLHSLGVTIVTSTRITRVKLDASGQVTTIALQPTKFDESTYEWKGAGKTTEEPVENLVLALPPMVLARLVREGPRGQRIVDALPQLAELKRVTSQQVPILQVSFTSKLAGVPTEPVGLLDSELNLAFTDVSQSWTSVKAFSGRTVLAVTCSEPFLLTGPALADGYSILKELSEYLGFDPGKKWGESGEIEWSLTRYHSNSDTQISLNAIGTDGWRPLPWHEEVENLFFAGDFCRNDFGITTIEAAVATGLAASGELVRLRKLGSKVELTIPETVPAEDFVALRYLWLPAAYAAKGLSMSEELSAQAQGAPAGPGAPGAGTSAASGQQGSGTPAGAGAGAPKQLSALTYLLTPGLPPKKFGNG